MASVSELSTRSGSKCELCLSATDLATLDVVPSDGSIDKSIMLCSTCKEQIENPDSVEANHWRCLNDSMWNEHPAVQVMAWRMLNQLKATESWAQDLIEQIYMEETTLEWAKAGIPEEGNAPVVVKDSNGTVLVDGDEVTLIKDLVVKGANFTAKRGTMVKNISLNGIEGQIEGRVNGTKIVLLTCFLKKQN
ncbi:PhnA domain protein [Halobacteriovorax marinus]|uniref:PhnA domain protein n=1 Tax=Halobacteriovorax marinus TaxID=97084 RepID=A0A1Y5FIL7_9BACT|nr:PhnA domain protein [Halobacteriovorax marinus]